MFEPIFKEFNRFIGEIDLSDWPQIIFAKCLKNPRTRTYAEFQLETHLTWQTNKSVTAAIGNRLYNSSIVSF